ncbi:putative transcriptional regulator [Neobacillus sp. B4I6]|uniref:helix-turn-helix domain-containing protein n=1 Tax=Neobacillus sp. B4I6 TaxID=3373925 RepID=UPI003D25E29D
MGKKVIVMFLKILEERNMSIRQLSLLSGVRQAALNQLVNQQRHNINFGHIEKIAKTLEINDMNQIIALVDTDDDDDDD